MIPPPVKAKRKIVILRYSFNEYLEYSQRKSKWNEMKASAKRAERKSERRGQEIACWNEFWSLDSNDLLLIAKHIENIYINEKNHIEIRMV